MDPAVLIAVHWCLVVALSRSVLALHSWSHCSQGYHLGDTGYLVPHKKSDRLQVRKHYPLFVRRELRQEPNALSGKRDPPCETPTQTPGRYMSVAEEWGGVKCL